MHKKKTLLKGGFGNVGVNMRQRDASCNYLDMDKVSYEAFLQVFINAD